LLFIYQCEKTDGIKDMVKEAEDVVNKVNDNMLTTSPSPSVTPTESTQDTTVSLNTIADYLKVVGNTKDYFTKGHKEIGYIYKPTHDNINDLWAFVNSFKIECKKNSFNDTWSYENKLTVFGKGKYDLNLTMDSNIYTYTKTGKAYKSNKLEKENYSYTIINKYDPKAGTFTYDHNRIYVSDNDYTKLANYYIDNSGVLYISYAKLDITAGTLEQMLVYYDGEVVKVGHKLNISTDTVSLLVDPCSLKPSSLDDFFGNLEFNVTLSYDGNSTTHSNID